MIWRVRLIGGLVPIATLHRSHPMELGWTWCGLFTPGERGWATRFEPLPRVVKWVSVVGPRCYRVCSLCRTLAEPAPPQKKYHVVGGCGAPTTIPACWRSNVNCDACYLV